MKIVGFEIEDWEQKPFDRLKDKHEVLLTGNRASDDLDSRFRNAEIISTFIYSKLNEGNLDQVLADKVLADQPNVLITPHIGFNTREAVERLLDSSVENIVSFIEGTQRNVVLRNGVPRRSDVREGVRKR
jgi:phosphoglycerate dehydrogenase-like enzyme